MSKPLILSDNLFENVVLHPTFGLVSATADDTAGHELFRIADNLRDLTSWGCSGSNTQHNIYVDCVAAVVPNILILDRGHNLGGQAVRFQGFPDLTITGGVNIFTSVVPVTAGGLASDANGCLTPDGVWWKTFTGQSWRVALFQIDPMGVGKTPIITGLHVGVSYRFPEYLNAPGAYDYGTGIKYIRNDLSRGGLRSKSRPINFDKIPIAVDLEGVDYAGFDVEVRRLLRYNQPWWFCLDDSDATGCGLMRLFQSSGDLDYTPQVNPVHREIRLMLEEVLPSLYA